jgi:S-adenosylmethionine hydrolase
VITLTTDFGLADHFVGVMKGVILRINPEAGLVDISHEVDSYDVLDGAFTLAQSYRFFPPGTIHLVVVDPGVGSARRPILVSVADAQFVAPDNGVLSMIYEREPDAQVRHITRERYFLRPVSNTFHGRDIFAPVAAWLSKGVEPREFGEVITDYVRLAPPKPRRLRDGNEQQVEGSVLKVDKFGDLVTNITPEDVAELFSAAPPPFRIIIGGREISRLCQSFSEGGPQEALAILGSSGFVEIGINQGSAAKVLEVNRGALVVVILERESTG